MSNYRRRYQPELEAQKVVFVRSDPIPDELAREFPPAARSSRDWVKQADLDEARRADGATTGGQEQ